jgi:hypothetical protein
MVTGGNDDLFRLCAEDSRVNTVAGRNVNTSY